MRTGSVDLWTLFITDAFNASVTADEDILESDITLSSPKTFTDIATFTFEVSFAAAGNFYFVIKKDGTERLVKTINGAQQGINCGGTYNVALSAGYSLNIRYTATTTLNYMTVTAHGGRI